MWLPNVLFDKNCSNTGNKKISKNIKSMATTKKNLTHSNHMLTHLKNCKIIVGIIYNGVRFVHIESNQKKIYR